MNNSRITKFSKIIIWCVVVVSSLHIFFNLFLANFLTTAFESEEITEDIYNYVGGLLAVSSNFLGLINVFFIFVSYILLSKWFYISCKLNHLNGVRGLETSPRWAWLWYAIPIATLFKPYQSLEETYKASFQKEDWEEILVPWVFPIWWLSWLVSGFLFNRSADQFFNLTEDSLFENWVTYYYTVSAFDLINIVSAFALLQIVKTISKNQSKLNFDINYTISK